MFKKYIYEPRNDGNTILVFFSNIQGQHVYPTQAVNYFEAEEGVPEGRQGKSYAIPTYDRRVFNNENFHSVSETEIVANIRTMYNYAIHYPFLKFFIEDRNLTERSPLDGYTGSELASMFNEAGQIPNNIFFPEEWFKSILLSNKITK